MDEQEIRKPIPSFRSCILYDDLEDLDTYIKSLEKQNLDPEIKNAMIETRRDFLLTHRPDLVKDSDVNKVENFVNNEFVERALNLSEFTKEINLITNIDFRKRFEIKLVEYINVNTDYIVLDYSDYDQFLEFIEFISKTKNNNQLFEYIKSITKPIDSEGYQIYKEALEITKKEFEEKQKLILIKENRKMIFDKLLLVIKKIIKYDQLAYEVYDIIKDKYETWIDLDYEFIQLDEEEYNKVKQFINSIKLSQKDKEDISNVFIHI